MSTFVCRLRPWERKRKESGIRRMRRSYTSSTASRGTAHEAGSIGRIHGWMHRVVGTSSTSNELHRGAANGLQA